MSVYDETIFHIWKIFEKRCYYLMSAAGAGIGYSIATIQPEITLVETRLLLASLIFWALSFFSGLAVISNLRTIIGFHSVTPKHLQESIQAGVDEHAQLLKNIDLLAGELQQRNKFYHSLQITLIALAAVLLVMSKVDISVALGFQT